MFVLPWNCFFVKLLGHLDVIEPAGYGVMERLAVKLSKIWPVTNRTCHIENQFSSPIFSTEAFNSSAIKEIINTIRLKRPKMPVILVSGYLAKDAGKAIVDETAAFLQKPVSPTALVMAVARVLSKSKRP